MTASAGLGWFVAGAASTLAAQRLARSPQLRLAAMSGTTIATPDAAGWFTDFLNAAYYRRPAADRSVDDLRLAFCILTTRWHQLGGRRLTGLDVLAFHRAFGAARFVDDWTSPRGTLNHRQLLDGGRRLLGDWFADAYADPARRGWGIAFETAAAKASHDPARRLANAPLGPLAPPSAPVATRTWHTYPAVELPSADAAVATLRAVERWPDFGSSLGRFTPLRPGGLDGQTFEIEIIAAPVAPAPVLVRAYVTATAVRSRDDDPADLRAAVDELNGAHARYAADARLPLPDGADPVALVELTSHEGHFMGAAVSRLLVFEHRGGAFVRDAGTWDPMAWHLDQMYARIGRHAQHAFWGIDAPDESMLHQLAHAADGRT